MSHYCGVRNFASRNDSFYNLFLKITANSGTKDQHELDALDFVFRTIEVHAKTRVKFESKHYKDGRETKERRCSSDGR